MGLINDSPHSEEAVQVTQYAANYFISQARKSRNRPPLKNEICLGQSNIQLQPYFLWHGRDMDDSLSPLDPTAPQRHKLTRKFTKVLRLRAASGKRKEEDDINKSRSSSNRYEYVALLAKLFAGVSSVKAAYAQLQLAQCIYNSDEIQSADHLIVSELMLLSDLKLCYVKKQFDFLPEKVIVSSEIHEQKSSIKTYETALKKLEFHNKRRDSELEQMKAKLRECEERNKMMRKKLNESGHLYVLDNVHPTGLNPSHFVAVLHHAVRSIRSFVRTIVNGMKSTGWDLASAANAICPGMVFWKKNHVCFAFESFVSLEMFSDFEIECESFEDAKARTRYFYEKFNELKSMDVNECLAVRPGSTFGRFCKAKYLALIHQEMELSLCGDLTQRRLVEFGGFPETKFFSTFAEMAKRVWLLHCLAFSFDPRVSIFQIRPGSRFSEVYMESLADEAFNESETVPKVAFTVIPGFQIGKTILQSQVFLN